MGNRFYIPAQNDVGPLDFAKLGLTLYGLKQHGDQFEKNYGLEQEKLRQTGLNAAADQALKAEQIVTQQEHNRVLGRQADTQASVAQTAARVTPIHTQTYGSGDDIALKIFAKNYGIDGDDNPIIQRSKELAANPQISKLQAWEIFRSDDSLRESTIEALQQKIMKASDKDPGYLGTKEGQADYEKLQALSSHEGWQKLVDKQFSRTLASYQTELQSKKNVLTKDQVMGEIARGVMEGRITEEQGKRLVSMMAPDKFMSVREGGSVVNPLTGEVVATVPGRADKPAVVPPGGALVDSTGARLFTNPNKPDSERPVVVPEGATLTSPTGAPLLTTQKTTKGPTATEQRMEEKAIADAEGKILANKSNDAAAGQVDYFNQNAVKPYAYTWKPGKLYGGTWEKAPLPKNNAGKQITAKDIWDYAQQKGMTYEDVLNQVLQAVAGKK